MKYGKGCQSEYMNVYRIMIDAKYRNLRSFKDFKVVFSCDNIIPQEFDREKCIYLVNTANSRQFIGHWILITFFFKKGQEHYCEIFLLFCTFYSQLDNCIY